MPVIFAGADTQFEVENTPIFSRTYNFKRKSFFFPITRFIYTRLKTTHTCLLLHFKLPVPEEDNIFLSE